MSGLASRMRWLFAAACLLVLAGCATPQRPAVPAGVQVWTGRLALTVEGQQSQSFSAGFELKGSAQTGELTLFSPLGGMLAQLSWSPAAATLRTSDGARDFPSLEALAREATGSPLPVASLFDWLEGKATPAEGWQVDVSQVAQGRLAAQRTAPPPAADLRIAFER